MSFEKAWRMAKVGQMLKYGTFRIVKSDFLSIDTCLAIKSGLPLLRGWELDESGIKIIANYEAVQ